MYLSPLALLQNSRASEGTVSALESNRAAFRSVKKISDLLAGSPSGNDVFSEDLYADQNIDSARTVLLSYRLGTDMSPNVPHDTVEWELKARNRVGVRSCRFGAEWDPSKEHLRVAAGISADADQATSMRLAFRIARQLADLERHARTASLGGPQERFANGQALMGFLLRATFGWDKLVRFRPAAISADGPAFVEIGSTKTAEMVRDYLRSVQTSTSTDPDTLHEIRVLTEALQKLPYRGLLIAYAGSAELTSTSTQLAEFDGLIFVLGDQPALGSLLIVEAKNIAGGATVAKKQLEKRLTSLAVPKFNVADAGRRGAIAAISI